jgi:hypothetical protein
MTERISKIMTTPKDDPVDEDGYRIPMSLDKLSRLNNEVALSVYKRVNQSRRAILMAERFLEDIPGAFVDNGAVMAIRSITDLLDRTEDHYIAAMKSVLEKYGIEEVEGVYERSEITQEGGNVGEGSSEHYEQGHRSGLLTAD